MNTDLNIARARTLARLKKVELEGCRRTLQKRISAAKVLPVGWNDNQRRLSEMRAKSHYEKFPSYFKAKMEAAGYKDGCSSHYALDLV